MRSGETAGSARPFFIESGGVFTAASGTCLTRAVLGRLPMEQAAAAERFRLLTDAWSIARDPHLRAKYDAFLSNAAQGFEDGSAQPLRPQVRASAVFAVLLRLVRLRFAKRLPWCWCADGAADRPLLPKLRHCNVREITNRTLLTGWWGVLSFFTNRLTIAGNLDARRRFGRLSASEPNLAVAAWLPAPIPAGRPVSNEQASGLLALFLSSWPWSRSARPVVNMRAQKQFQQRPLKRQLRLRQYQPRIGHPRPRRPRTAPT